MKFVGGRLLWAFIILHLPAGNHFSIILQVLLPGSFPDGTER